MWQLTWSMSYQRHKTSASSASNLPLPPHFLTLHFPLFYILPLLFLCMLFLSPSFLSQCIFFLLIPFFSSFFLHFFQKDLYVPKCLWLHDLGLPENSDVPLVMKKLYKRLPGPRQESMHAWVPPVRFLNKNVMWPLKMMVLKTMKWHENSLSATWKWKIHDAKFYVQHNYNCV